MAYIHMYTGNPTAGGTDGTLVSEGTGSAPVTTAQLNATNNEVGTGIKLALRCDTKDAQNNYNTQGNTVVTPVGTSASKWALSSDGTNFGAYGAALTITSVITTVNTIIWAKAKATSDEDPDNDATVDLQVSATIVAVAV